MTKCEGYFNTATDYQGNVVMQCKTCNEYHIFMNNYFAKQWANAHADGRHTAVRGEVK